MDITFDQVRDALAFVNLAIGMVLGCVIWLRKPGADAQQSVKNLHSQLTQQTQDITTAMSNQHHLLDKRLTAVEVRIEDLPTRENLMQLKGEFAALGEKVDALKDNAAITRGGVERIEKWLINRNHTA